MTDRRNRYRTIFRAQLVQRTALSIAGRDLDTLADYGFALDGLGRPVLRGTGLAGALIATARDLFEHEPAESITHAKSGTEVFHRDSAWILHNSHLLDPARKDWHYRSGIGISQRTGAAAEAFLSDTETLPAGSRWGFCLEVDHALDNERNSALFTACHILKEWQTNGFLIGREVARGMGWTRMESLEVLELSQQDLAVWPDAAVETFRALDHLFLSRKNKVCDLDALMIRLGLDGDGPARRVNSLRGTITLHAGLSDWGLDSLSIGGHDMNPGLKLLDRKVLRPLGQCDYAYKERLRQSDLTFSWMRRYGRDQPEPFIPGGSLRGAIRHAFSWIERRRGNAVWDPTDSPRKKPPNTANEKIAAWFGTPDENARFFLSDAFVRSDDWRFVLFEQHAEDEFTQGVFGDSKFERLGLVKGTFAAEFIFRYRLQSEMDEFKKALDQYIKMARWGLAPIGGNAYRGQGALQWSIDHASTDGQSGPGD
jgi:CRISPR/Cas system CSM-associated protein Csm3 (group 7 of RAMP superfamily)